MTQPDKVINALASGPCMMWYTSTYSLQASRDDDLSASSTQCVVEPWMNKHNYLTTLANRINLLGFCLGWEGTASTMSIRASSPPARAARFLLMKPCTHPLNHITCMGKTPARMAEGRYDPPVTEARLYGMRYEMNMTTWKAIRVMKKATAKAMLERKRGYKNEMPRIKVGN